MEAKPVYLFQPDPAETAGDTPTVPSLPQGPLVIEYGRGEFVNLDTIIAATLSDDGRAIQLRLPAPNDVSRGPYYVTLTGKISALVLLYLRRRAAQTRAMLQELTQS